MPTTRTAPLMSVLADGTVPNYCSGTPDSGQTITPGLICYKSGTSPDPEFTPTTALYGSSLEDQATIYVKEIEPSHPSIAQSYLITGSVTAETDTGTWHEIEIGDVFWATCAQATLDETDLMVCGAAGVVVQGKAGGDTADAWNVHTFKVVGPNKWTDATWVKVKYLGLGVADTD